MYLRQSNIEQQRRGAAATELALWLPFLGLLFVIALDFCRVYFTTQTIENCACVGAMYASGAATGNPSSPDDPIVAAVLAEGISLHPALQSTNVSVATSGNQTSVTVTYEFPMLIRWPGIAGNWTITRTVSMPVVPSVGS